MRLQIDRTVRGNLERFRALMQRMLHKKRRGQHGVVIHAEELQLPILVHRASGRILFPEISPVPEGVHEFWTPLILRIAFQPGKAPLAELLPPALPAGEKQNAAFCCSDFSPAAYARLKETIEALASACHHLKGAEDLQRLIALLAETGLDPLALLSEGELILHAWHPINRIQAEQLLAQQLPGSFLLRRDQYTQWLEGTLLQAFHQPIKCFTLTYLSHEGTVRERTILHHNERWLLYDDNPSLTGETYPSLQELFHRLF